MNKVIDYNIDEDYYTGWEERKTYKGNVFWVWKLDMRISDTIIDSSIYLYPSEQDAKDGEKVGGSGFLVAYPSEISGKYDGYAVTNSHVIREAKSPIVRLNTKEGDMDILSLNNDDWQHHPNGDDLAAAPIFIDPNQYRIKFVPLSMFITQEIISTENIGAGDDVFMVGRFMGYDGKQKNVPTVRFGNLAIGDVQPIAHPRGYLQESFLVETRSLSGYSGSPVFVYIAPFSKRPESKGWSTEKGPWLLGIDWGHEHFMEKVLGKDGETPITEGWKVRTNSGITNVVPVWKLVELLNIKEFVDLRKMIEKGRIELQKEAQNHVTLDSHEQD